jgi:hypothetical protein
LNKSDSDFFYFTKITFNSDSDSLVRRIIDFGHTEAAILDADAKNHLRQKIAQAKNF